MVEFVFLNIWKFDLPRLEHFSICYELFNNPFYFPNLQVYCWGPAHRSAQAGVQAGPVAEGTGLKAGPDRGQAGALPEQAGLVAGPGRGEGRAC